MATAYIGIGSNIGDRRENFKKAIDLLKGSSGIKILDKSSFYVTAPVGGPPQDDYLNGVLKIETKIDPRGLLARLKWIEKKLGRKKKAGLNYPRVIDLDLLIYDDLILNEKNFVIPHPRMHQRIFVLKGFFEIEPDLIHPVKKETIRELLKCTGNCRMTKINKIEDIREFVTKIKKSGETIGFVPTMGYLHEGHLSLVRKAKEECDTVIVSVFVNEKQFGPGEDFARYPRNIDRDSFLAEQAGADTLFIPGPEEIYPGGYSTYIDVEGTMTEVLCAKSRPGHFRGVCTVVAKFFNITRADISYFGQKDYQQALVLRKMVEELNINTELKILPIVREKDGLAMSSRNAYLSEEERKRALTLHKALLKAKEMTSAGINSLSVIKENIRSIIAPDDRVRIDYVDILDAKDLEQISEKTKEILVAIAVYVGKTRLIDNILLEI